MDELHVNLLSSFELEECSHFLIILYPVVESISWCEKRIIRLLLGMDEDVKSVNTCINEGKV